MHKPSSRAKSVAEMMSRKFNTMHFDGEWYEAIGEPEMAGAWIIWGSSYNGKTRFALQLSKYLTRFGRVVYDSLEEGACASMRDALKAVGMIDVKRKFILLDKEPIDDLKIRLSKRNSPEIVVIDSIQYASLNYAQYKELRDTFRNKLFIIISHAKGLLPSGRVAESIRYDAFVKIRVEGYKAFCKSRYGGGVPYIIWEEGANEYWGER